MDFQHRRPLRCSASGELAWLASCGVVFSRAGLIEAAKLGRVAGHSPEARARQAEKQRRHATALKAWNPSDKPDWLTEDRERIQPRIAGITVPAIASTLGVSQPYAAEIRAGRYMPHPRHWLSLARVVGISWNEKTGAAQPPKPSNFSCSRKWERFKESVVRSRARSLGAVTCPPFFVQS